MPDVCVSLILTLDLLCATMCDAEWGIVDLFGNEWSPLVGADCANNTALLVFSLFPQGSQWVDVSK